MTAAPARKWTALAVACGLVGSAVVLSACSSAGRDAAPVVALAAEDTPAANTGSQRISNKDIPILVNDVPITQYDINQRIRLMRLGGAGGSTQAAANELIDETLQSIEAQRRGVSVSEAQVDGAFAGIADRLKLSPTQLTAALRSEGIEATSLKNRLKVQMQWQSLVQRRTQSKGSVRGDEITAALMEKGDPNALTVSEYVLQQIVFVVPQGSPANLYAQRRQEAEAFRQRFKGCENSLEQAKQLRGVVVKEIGRRDSSQLQGSDAEVISKTPVGKTGPAARIDQGVELIAVCSKRDVQSTALARAEIENELYMKQAENLGADYLKELRDRAIIVYR